MILISELIKRLNDHINQYGDCPAMIVIQNSEEDYKFTAVEDTLTLQFSNKDIDKDHKETTIAFLGYIDF